MTDNLCDSCTNIGCEFQTGIVRTKCNFYMPPHIEPDNCGNYVVMQPTVEAIPKDQYEARLKSDMVAMLEELKEELREMHEDFFETEHYDDAYGVSVSMDVIQQKIDKLKGEKRGRQWK